MNLTYAYNMRTKELKIYANFELEKTFENVIDLKTAKKLFDEYEPKDNYAN